MTACAVAALTIYDMCKSADRSMVIGDLALWEKTGGRSGHWRRPTGDLADPARQHRRQSGCSTWTTGIEGLGGDQETDPLGDARPSARTDPLCRPAAPLASGQVSTHFPVLWRRASPAG